MADQVGHDALIMKKLVIVFLALAATLPAAAQGIRKTAEEFNRMVRSDTSLVQLKGVVCDMRIDPRGVFYLEDETGKAYIYGLVDGREGSNVSFTQMEIAPGDTVTVYGRRTVYKGVTIEMTGGHLLRKADGPNHAEMLESIKGPDKYPTFKGKDANAFSSWVTSRLQYPRVAKDNHIEGTVLVRFVIGTNGGVQEVEVLESVHPAIDAEAVRVIKSSPKWKPGMKDGKPVRVSYTFPVIFVLPDY